MEKISKEQMKKEKWTYTQKLDYYCNINNEITMATGNRKLGSQVVGLSMPAIITCRCDAPCKSSGCYATKGCQSFSNIYGTYLKNLRIYNEIKDEFFDKITNYLKFSGYKYMRFFDSGDIPDKQFLIGIIKITKDNPNVKFMMYTKRYEWVNELLLNIQIPDNLTIVFSAWDKNWSFPNPFNLPVAYVDFKDNKKNPIIPQNAFNCTGCCSTCFKCWFLKNNESVVFCQH